MDHTEVQELAERALQAAIRYDQAEVNAACQPILEEGDPGHIFLWVLGMATVATQGHPRGQDVWVHQPMVARYNPATGDVEDVPIDQAPLGVATYSRIAAAWMNDDKDSAHAAFTVLVKQADQDGGEQIGVCMSQALQQAAARVRAGQSWGN